MGSRTRNPEKLAKIRQDRLSAVTRMVERMAEECPLNPNECGCRGSGNLCLKEFATEQGGYHPDCKEANHGIPRSNHI